MIPAFDQLLRRLVEEQVEFVLVGGLALNSWGVVRGTKDVDVVIDPDIANLTRIARLAVELNGRVQVGDALLGSERSITAALADGDQVAIETELGRLDVIQGLDGVPAFAELRARAEPVKLLGVELFVCSLEDLRAMKRAAGRTTDLADLEELDAADSKS
jgi:predicted nucleotidyltransferase